MFQSTRPRGARPQFCHRRNNQFAVSIHAPAWGATEAFPKASVAENVSIHAPAWGATAWAVGSSAIWKFQSTRPHGARPAREAVLKLRELFQSTRPRGARPGCRKKAGSRKMFQSTRPRGARRWRSLQGMGCAVRFNPRARGGRDPRPMDWPTSESQVSIHAPAGGATNSRIYAGTCDASFNPRARGGRDAVNLCPLGNEQMFQSTRPRGARPCVPIGSATFAKFQSTRPRGARLHKIPFKACRRPVSIHAPAGGATFGSASSSISVSRFQSTRPRGARLARSCRGSHAFLFQSTRPRGARLFKVGIDDAVVRFQSTRPRGARRPSLSSSVSG